MRRLKSLGVLAVFLVGLYLLHRFLPSQHSYANAIDISGFVLQDGRRISVREDWRARTDEGKYLARVHKGACRLFSVTLGPDYNAAHADHFHFDMGSAETCK